jgi:hypothetical protein
LANEGKRPWESEVVVLRSRAHPENRAVEIMSSASDASHWRPILDRVTTILDELGATGWIVGGSLRDALLGLPVRDVDLAVTIDPSEIARRLALQEVAGIAQLRRGTIRVALQESPEAHLDLTLVQGGSIARDLALRDFRINALALPLAAREFFLDRLQQDGEPPPILPPQLVDPFAGLDDLHARRLDAVSGSVFRDDPGRILRGARLAAHLDLAATARTVALACEAAAQLADLPGDRVREELNVLLALPCATTGFALLREMQALPALFAAAEAGSIEQADVVWAHMVASLAALSWLHTAGGRGHHAIYKRLPANRLQTWYAVAASGESLPRIVALGWATVLHALTPDETGRAVARSGGHVQQAQPTDVPVVRGLPARVRRVLNAWHDAQTLISAERMDATALRRFFDYLGPGGGSALDALMVALACLCARAESGTDVSDNELERAAENVGRITTAYFDDPDTLMPPSLIDGAQVIRELGIAPGPSVGRILRAVRAEQLAGTISTVEEALAYARKLIPQER